MCANIQYKHVLFKLTYQDNHGILQGEISSGNYSPKNAHTGSTCHSIHEWHIGLGLIGEQGAESIHAYFNRLKRTYSNIPNEVDHLKYMMNEHFPQVAPCNGAADNLLKEEHH